jgi:hypothetical protein
MADPVSAIGGAVSIGGSVMQSKSAGKAAKSQQAAADAATAEQTRQFDILQENQKPFLSTGTAANQRLAYLLGLNPNSTSVDRNAIGASLGFQTKAGQTSVDFMPFDRWKASNPSGSQSEYSQQEYQWRVAQAERDKQAASALPEGFSAEQNAAIDAEIARRQPTDDPNYGSLTKSFGMSDYTADPGYAFRLSEGQKALDRAAASKGGFNSGAAAKALIDYNQNMGSQEYGSAYDRYNTNQTNLYNRLAGISGTGQMAANTLGSAGQNYANAVSGNINAAGNARAAGSIAQGNAWSTGLNNVASSLAPAYKSWDLGNTVSNSVNNPANAGFF